MDMVTEWPPIDNGLESCFWSPRLSEVLAGGASHPQRRGHRLPPEVSAAAVATAPRRGAEFSSGSAGAAIGRDPFFISRFGYRGRQLCCRVSSISPKHREIWNFEPREFDISNPWFGECSDAIAHLHSIRTSTFPNPGLTVKRNNTHIYCSRLAGRLRR